MMKTLHKHSPAVLLIVVALLGLLNVPQVGISWDEPAQRWSAGLSAINVAEKFAPGLTPKNYSRWKADATDLSTNIAVDHGVAFDAPVLVLETLLRVESTRNIYLLHHVVNWFAFLIGLVAFYLILSLRFRRREIALLGASFFLLSPRILAEGFYNSKDITFMCFLLLATYFVLRMLEAKKSNFYRMTLLAGVVGGYSTDIRILGLIQLPLVLLVIFISKQETSLVTLKMKLKQAGLYLSAFALTVYALFPYLWSDPIGNLIKVFKSMSSYGWTGYVLYMGDRVQAQNLPWHYLLIWISVTTPILYLILFLFGSTNWIFRLFKKRSFQLNFPFLADFYAFALFSAPLIIIIGLHSTLYDSWRHVYFVYPYILYFAVKGYLFLESRARKAILGLRIFTVGYLLFISIWIFMNSPMQNLYFNSLAGSHIESRWEMDYWGLSNESALRFILNNDSRAKISIQEVSFMPLSVSSKMLSISEQARFVYELKTEPTSDYIVSNFRSGTVDPIPRSWPGYSTFKKFSMDGFTYLEILKRNT